MPDDVDTPNFQSASGLLTEMSIQIFFVNHWPHYGQVLFS